MSSGPTAVEVHGAGRATSARSDRQSPELLPAKWGAGLRFGAKALNTKSVSRAKAPDEVLSVCLAHNLRQGNEKHRHRSPIDPARTALNQVIHGPACLVAAEGKAASTLAELGAAPRRADSIMGLELVLQPPDGADTPAFWSACMAWVTGRYEHVLSAVVHLDQERPHMHVLVLAVANGRLDGNYLTAGKNRFTRQRLDFLAFIRDTLGLRPDRKVKTLTDTALSTGRGPKTRAAADRSDAALLRRTAAAASRAEMGMGVGGHGGSELATTNHHAHHETATPLLRSPSRRDAVFALWRSLVHTAGASRALPTPAPRPTANPLAHWKRYQ